MLFVDAPTQAPTVITSQAPQVLTWTQQALLWVNGLTLPAIIIGAIKGSRWFTQKEDGIKNTVEEFRGQLTLIKDNHLHTMQESLKEIAKDQSQGFKDLIATQNSAKDAIVQAILLTKK